MTIKRETEIKTETIHGPLSGDKIRILVIAGPTAAGKTAFAIEAARKFNGEIVSCDSMQLYRGMDIGSAKPTPEERAQVPHHCRDGEGHHRRYRCQGKAPCDCRRYRTLSECSPL